MASPIFTSQDGESRKILEQRARDATRPMVVVARGKWPFKVEKTSPMARSDRDTDTPNDKPTASSE